MQMYNLILERMNFAVFLTLLEPGDTIMGMDLSHGGHLTTVRQ